MSSRKLKNENPSESLERPMRSKSRSSSTPSKPKDRNELSHRSTSSSKPKDHYKSSCRSRSLFSLPELKDCHKSKLRSCRSRSLSPSPDYHVLRCHSTLSPELKDRHRLSCHSRSLSLSLE